MSKEEKVTKISLELIIGRKTNILLKGSCYEETPNMKTQVAWYHCNGSVPKRSISPKELLGEATLSRKYSQLMTFVNQYFPEKTHQIKYSFKREK